MSRIIKKFVDDTGDAYNVTTDMVENRQTFVQYCLDHDVPFAQAVANLCWAQGWEFVGDMETAISLFNNIGLKPARSEKEVLKKKLEDAGFRQEPAYWVMHDLNIGKCVRMSGGGRGKFLCFMWFIDYSKHDEDGNPLTDVEGYEDIDLAIKAAKDFMEAQ